MKKKKLQLMVIAIFLASALFFSQSVSAITASSENYSVSMFGTGIATSNPSSTNYGSDSLSTAGSGTRNAESNSYTVNIGFFENTTYYRTVSIASYSISPRSAVVGSTISLSILALNAKSVWARIVAPNSQEQTINLVNNQFIVYNPPSIVGRYNVIFYANSSSGAIASVVDYFELTAQTTPVTPPPSGGGGGGTTTIIEKCTYSWDCTPWGLCSDGKQKRTCENAGTCNGTESKPLEEMPCSTALFDIALKLNNIKLTENKTLKFNIDLTEKIGTGKIDVYIKYSIIDKEGNEIFSQIETKAVERNLSYEKEINEIKLTDGEYVLRTEIFYGYQQRAFTEQKIKISDGRIETEKSVSNIQKRMGVLNNYKLFIIIIIIIIIPVSRFLFLFRKDHYRERFSKIKRSKRRYFVYGLVFLLIFALLTIIPKINITGKVINNLFSYDWRIILILLAIISALILLIILRKRLALVYKKIAEFLSGISNKNKKHPHNSIKGLVNKKVYSESGHYIGKIKDVILGENRIESLKIKIDKKYKFNTRGVIIDYKHVRGVSEIIVVDEKITESFSKTEN